MFQIDVGLSLPQHSKVAPMLSYLYKQPIARGSLVRVPLGKKIVLAIVLVAKPLVEQSVTYKLREVQQVLDAIEPLNEHWLQLINFTANYYQRSFGEVALSALPLELKNITNEQLQQRITKLNKQLDKPQVQQPVSCNSIIELSPLQQQALASIEQSTQPNLLFGVTGSGKTEVYLKLVEQTLLKDSKAQVLVMVPEINLTPQLMQRFSQYFGPSLGVNAVVSMHSGMTNLQRFNSWLLMHLAKARILLGTRLTVLSSIPNLKVIVVDEEHDLSYKQYEGARYSARDLAIYRHKLLLQQQATQLSKLKPQVVLGSATPSLESWHAAKIGRYQLVQLMQRINNLALPKVTIIDMRQQVKDCIISQPLLKAINKRIEQGQQVMLFLNRRGYSHIICCPVCNWKSQCPNCSVLRPYHKVDNSLHCHHCGLVESLGQWCPDCGSPLLEQLGHGTEQLEEVLQQQLAQIKKVDGSAIKLCRIDTDSVSKKGSLQQQLAKIHHGDIDVIIGTQMITKGHDFRRVTLVAAINPDQMLFSSNYRAPEQLFALLEQSAGRAGRDELFLKQHQQTAQMVIQTHYPQHKIFATLEQHNYIDFANQELSNRSQAFLPPFSYHALIRSDAKTQQQAQDFLRQLRNHLQASAMQLHITLYDVVPTTIAKLARVERAQLLVEAQSRKQLREFLSYANSYLKQSKTNAVLRWFIDVDPVEI